MSERTSSSTVRRPEPVLPDWDDAPGTTLSGRSVGRLVRTSSSPRWVTFMPE